MVSKIKPKFYSELLPLALRPDGSQDMAAWVPYPPSGDKLGEIIDQYNENLIEKLHRDKWLDEYIECLGMFLSVLNYDLFEAATLEKPRFEKVGIIILDIDAAQGNDSELEKIKVRMTVRPGEHIYKLTLTSQKAKDPPEKHFFEYLPILRSDPEILPDQKAFKDWLMGFSLFFQNVIEIAPPPDVCGAGGPSGPAGRGIQSGIEIQDEYKYLWEGISEQDEWLSSHSYEAYLDELPRLIASISDRSLAEGLSVEQAAEGAHSAVAVEYGLRRLAAAFETPEHPYVVIDALRTQFIQNMEVGRPEFQPEELYGLSVNRPISKINKRQRRELRQIGIESQDEMALFHNLNGLFDQENAISGVLDLTYSYDVLYDVLHPYVENEEPFISHGNDITNDNEKSAKDKNQQDENIAASE